MSAEQPDRKISAAESAVIITFFFIYHSPWKQICRARRFFSADSADIISYLSEYCYNCAVVCIFNILLYLEKLVVGATSTPHGEILEQVRDDLAAAGYDLEVVIFDDYVLPNTSLNEGSLDANYFQHTPYLNSFNEANGTDLVAAASIHYEPFGLYGNGVESVAETPDGATIIIPADDINETRALLLLEQEGLITLPEGANAADGVTTLDIVDNKGYNIITVQADTVAAQFGK